MTSISNNGFIMLTRGDTFSAPLFINWGTKCQPVRYYIKNHPGATVYFGVMEVHQPFEQAIIKRYYKYGQDQNGKPILNEYGDTTNECGDIIITLRPQDTEFLLPGKYYYAAKVVNNKGEVDTIIPKTEFFILE